MQIHSYSAELFYKSLRPIPAEEHLSATDSALAEGGLFLAEENFLLGGLVGIRQGAIFRNIATGDSFQRELKPVAIFLHAGMPDRRKRGRIFSSGLLTAVGYSLECVTRLTEALAASLGH